jgi:ferredoxin
MAETRRVRVSVDHDICVGNAACTRRAPAVFRLDKNRQSEPINAETYDWRAALQAAENCPVSAITAIDAETGESLFANPA